MSALVLATTPPRRELSLHSQQGLVFRSPARYRVVAAGRRWGKTVLGLTALLASCGQKPSRYWYIAPELKQARDIAWRPLHHMVPRTWLAKSPNESRLEAEFINGSSLALKGADDPDSLRGRGIGGVVIDEYADIDPVVWDEIILPSLLDTGGWALILGTPKGYDHFYDLYSQGQDTGFQQWASWQFRTADAPHIKQHELLEIRKQYEQRGQLRLYQQEFEASFETNAGYILGAMWKATHTVTAEDRALLAHGLTIGQVIPWHVIDDEEWTPPSGALIYGSVDYGYGAPWASYLHAALPGGHSRTWHEWYAREVTDIEQARRMRYGIERLMRPADQGGISMSKPEWIVMDPAMWANRKDSGLAKSIAEVYEDELGIPLNIALVPGAGGRPARLSRPQRWMAALDVAPDGWPWWAVTSACPNLIRTVPRVPWDEDDLEVEDDDSDNHAYESTGRYFEARPHAPALPKVDPLSHLDPLSRREARVLESKFTHKPSRGTFGRLGRS